MRQDDHTTAPLLREVLPGLRPALDAALSAALDAASPGAVGRAEVEHPEP
ncbi:hypothetical protein ACFWFZ_30345 [Streptomyces sp. NPDC060232]